MKKLLFKLLGIALVLGLIQSCEKTFIEDEPTNEIDLNSALKSASVNSNVVPDQYIVVFKKNITNSKAEVAIMKGRYGFEPGHIYEHALKGFSATIPANAVKGLKNNPNIASIEPVLIQKAFEQFTPTGIARIQANLHSLAGDNVDVDVAILDSGVDEDHPDINVVGGRHFWSVFSGPPKRRGSFVDDNYDDDNGHGTHVAGTVAAINNDIGVVGVAPGARIWGIKILDASGSGYTTDIIAGLDWVSANAATIEVVNMSIGGQGLSPAYQEAIQNVVNAGVVVVVAAGNESMDVYGDVDGVFGTSDDIIPAAYPEVAAISAMGDTDGQPGGLGTNTSYDEPDDSFASAFSNFSQSVVSGNPVNSPGKAIDLALPGVDITSTYMGGGYATGSGTSMASPHGAGLAALYIADNGRATNAAGVYAIRQALIDAGVAQDSPNGFTTLNDPDGFEENIGWINVSVGNQKPVADFSFSATELLVQFTDASTDTDGTIASWSWDFGDESGTSTSQNPSYTYATDGTYSVKLIVTDNEGATNEITKDVTVAATPVNQKPVADFSFSATELLVQFTDASTDTDGTIASWNWDFGDLSGTSTSQNPSYTYAADGTYSVKLIVTDNEGATNEITKDITVAAIPINQDPVADFSFSATELLVQFTDASTDADGTIASWSWDFGDLSGTSTSQNPSYTYSADGTYSVILVVTDNEGATNEITKDITVAAIPINQDPVADFSFSATELLVQFTDASTDTDGTIASWNWDFGDLSGTSTSQNPSYTYSADGTYSVILVVTDNEGATNEITKDVTVAATPVNQKPVADFSYSTNYLAAYFTDESTDNDGTIISWNWDFGDGNTSSLQNPGHVYGAAGTYPVSLTVTDNEGATDNINISIDVEEEPTTEIILSGTGAKKRGIRTITLEWSGTTEPVDIYRDGVLIDSNVSGDSYIDNLGRVSGTFVYIVCDSSGCSNEIIVTVG